MHNDSNDHNDHTQTLAALGSAVTFTGITVTFALKIISGMPILANAIGITTGIAIILLEIISVCWAFIELRHLFHEREYSRNSRNGGKRRELPQSQDNLNLPPH